MLSYIQSYRKFSKLLFFFPSNERLWTKARTFYNKLSGSGECINAHDVVRFFHIYYIWMRTIQQNTKTAKAYIVDDIKKWRSTFSKRCIMTRVGINYHKKGGRFTTKEQLNFDQSHLPFVLDVTQQSDQSQPGSGLYKRRSSMQVMFRSSGKQPIILVIIRGGWKEGSA